MADERHKVFLSYSAHDRKWVDEFVGALTRHGVDVWYDMHEIQAGDRWQDSIQSALRGSEILVVLLSPHSVNSQWTFFEVGAAVASGKRIIPVLLHDLEFTDLPGVLAQFQALKRDTASDAGDAVANLVHSMDEPKPDEA